MTALYVRYQDIGEPGEPELTFGGAFLTRELARTACTKPADQVSEEDREYVEFPAWGTDGAYWLDNGKYYDMSTHAEVSIKVANEVL